MTFGDRLLACIKEANITQKQLAEQIGATPTQLNYWVKNKRQPDIPYIRALSKALGVSGDYLIGNTQEQIDVLYISRPSGDLKADEIRRFLHETIDQLDDDNLLFFKDFSLRLKR